jgi:hypothetical protein
MTSKIFFRNTKQEIIQYSIRIFGLITSNIFFGLLFPQPGYGWICSPLGLTQELIYHSSFIKGN